METRLPPPPVPPAPASAPAGGNPGAAASAMTAPIIDIQHLDFFYGQAQALQDITLQIPEKRVTAFIGPSGCGKSTHIPVLSGRQHLDLKEKAPQRPRGGIMISSKNQTIARS